MRAKRSPESLFHSSLTTSHAGSPIFKPQCWYLNQIQVVRLLCLKAARSLRSVLVQAAVQQLTSSHAKTAKWLQSSALGHRDALNSKLHALPEKLQLYSSIT